MKKWNKREHLQMNETDHFLLGFLSTLGFQINVRVQINIQVGKFAKNNKCTGPNKRTVKDCSN